MKRSEKKNFVQNLKEDLKNSSSVIVSHYAGLNVNKIDELRKAMRDNGTKFKVTKNRLTKLALADTQYTNISDLFTGPTAVAYSADPVAPAKISVEFEKKFRNSYGTQPPRLVTLAYDATALAAVLARNKNGPDFSAAAITNPSGYWGRDGIFRFVPDGVAERGFAIMQLGRKNLRVLSPAPEAFQPSLSN